MSQIAGYVLVFSDEDYDAVFPQDDPAVRRVLYPTVDAAVAAIKRWAEAFDLFRPVLYGQAFPYENTTFESELARTGRAMYGWAEMVDEDGEVTRYGLCAVALRTA